MTVLQLGACDGAQSALDPAGNEARQVTTLFWWLAGGAGVVWTVVLLLAMIAVRAGRAAGGPVDEKTAHRFIIGGGVIFPTVVLAALLWYGLEMMTELRRADAQWQIAISGERFWWRISYLEGVDSMADRPPAMPQSAVLFETANELRLPVGERIELLLTSPDVIHSFWVPALAGKMDLVPGRVTRLLLEPQRTGRFRGACAEFCGTGHGLMGMDVVVMERPAFDAWLADQRRAAGVAAGQKGADLFVARGCGACHTVRGTEAAGVIGPDLTHVGSRLTIGAALLPTTAENLARFIAHPQQAKAGAQMPSFAMLPSEEIQRLANWLAGLR